MAKTQFSTLVLGRPHPPRLNWTGKAYKLNVANTLSQYFPHFGYFSKLVHFEPDRNPKNPNTGPKYFGKFSGKNLKCRGTTQRAMYDEFIP
jgi:hypothetical protein